MLIALTLILTGCNSLPRDAADLADEQVASGQVTMPTSDNPVAQGDDGMYYLYTANADDGALTAAISHYGACVGVACQWDPTVDNGRPYGIYTDPTTGKSAFYTQFPVPSQGRGIAAEPGSEPVEWDNGETANAESQGVADGFYNLPWTGNLIVVVSDCGQMHPNYYFGWDENGQEDLPEDPSSIGSDYCADTGN